MGANKLTGFSPYGALWRAHRKLYHQHLGPKAMEQYSVRIETEARALAARLLENDREVCNQLKLFVPHPDDILRGSLSPSYL
jgi:cytochrome P450